MARSKRPTVWRPVELRRCLALKGGCTNRQYMPAVRVFRTDVHGGGESAASETVDWECVLISQLAPWLCEMGTGKAVSEKPLARVRIIQALHQLISQACGGQKSDTMMDALALSRDGSDDLDIHAKKKRKKQKDKASIVMGCHSVSVPEHPPHRTGCILSF